MNSATNSFYEFGPFLLDVKERMVLRDGQPLTLTPKAFETLLLLVQNSGHALTKEEMLKQLWPDTYVEEANLTNNISILRRALGDDSENQPFIKTIPRLGYRFVAAVKHVGDNTHDLATVAGSPTFTDITHAATTTRVLGLQTKRRWLIIGMMVACLLIAGIIVGLLVRRPRAADQSQLSPIRSIAVLPLTNLSGDPSQEPFADGMTEAVISELAKIGQLRVISRQSIMKYKRTRKTTPEIARELNVDAVVQGSVMRAEDRVRITAHLIRAQNDEHLWSESYERDLRDVLALQGELASGIARQVKIKLTPQEEARFANVRAVNPAAHAAYLNGLYLLNQAIDGTRPEEVERLHKKSFEYFEQAIKFDPNYAVAHSSLGVSYHFLASSGFPEFYSKAKESTLKALALDDSVAEAHASLAFILWRYEWDFAGAEKEFKRAEELVPNNYVSGYAQFLSAMGRHEEAIQRFRLNQELNPSIIFFRIGVGWAYIDSRQYDHAIRQFQGVLELEPKQVMAHEGLGTAYVLNGMYEQGIAERQRVLEEQSDRPENKANLAWAYAMAGRRSDANKILNDLKEEKSIPYLVMAASHAALGEKDQAMTYLEKSYEKRQGVLWLKVDPRFDSLRSDPRFQRLLRRIGFPQ